MDVLNPARGRAKHRRRVLIGCGSLGLLSVTILALTRLAPAAPAVDRRTLTIDTVRRGEMLRRVRGPGTLVPIETRWAVAPVAARVDSIAVQPGASVTADTVIVVMSSQEVEAASLEAEARLAEAEADYTRLAAQLEGEGLMHEAEAEAAESAATQARLQREAHEELAREGLVADLERKLSDVRASELGHLAELQRRRLANLAESAKAQLASERARLKQARGVAVLHRGRREGLHVCAGIDGVVQEVLVEAGQRVAEGAPLARVAQPERLKAVLRIPAIQAKDVGPGQPVEVDTRNGVVPGLVVRIDPVVQEGAVTVDVELTKDPPAGARPDLSVDGTIEIERLKNVLYVGRPASAEPNSVITLFRLEPDGQHARRMAVRLGKDSASTIEIVEGLAEGNCVILSDTSAWDGHERLRIK